MRLLALVLAFPVMGEGMYVPEIRANGAEARIRIMEAGDLHP